MWWASSTLGIHAANIGVPILVEELEAAGHTIDRTLNARQEEIKAEFTEKRGYWNAFWDGLLELDPDFFAAYLQFSSVPWRNGTLSPKFRELIYIAIDASTTHLYEPGLRQHIQNALRHGATSEEIMEVYELTAVLGIHACTLGVPVLIEELGDGMPELTPEQEERKAEFQERRGYWNPFWEGLLALDTEFFNAYLELSGVPWRRPGWPRSWRRTTPGR